MPDQFDDLKWTETPRMRCRITGARAYFKSLIVSLAKFALGFAIVFFLLTISNQQIWHARGPMVVLAAAAFGAFYRLLIEARPAFIRMNASRLYSSGGRQRRFVLADCRDFTLTPVAGFLRFEFDAPRRRGNGFEHVTIAAPESAYEYLAPLVAPATSRPITSVIQMASDSQHSTTPQLDYESKRINPYGGVLFGMGQAMFLLGILMLASPIVEYFFLAPPRSRLLPMLAISWPIGLIFAATGACCFRLGLPWIRDRIERSKRTRTLK